MVVGNNWLRVMVGLVFGALLGYLNYWLMVKSLTGSADPVAAIRKSSIVRFLITFLGLFFAIRLGGVAGLVTAALAMLALTWVGLFKIAKQLGGSGRDEQ